MKKNQTCIIIKPGKPKGETSSYCPLCMLVATSKVFEHLLLARLKRDLKNGENLAENQLGFRASRSTTDAGKRVYEIAKEANRGKTKKDKKTVCFNFIRCQECFQLSML